jgi:hyaluronoglucosaminidase
VAVALVTAASVAGCAGGDGGGDAGGGDAGRGGDAKTTTTEARPAPAELRARDDPLPVVVPTPQQARWLGDDVPVPAAVSVRVAPGVEPGTVTAVTEALRAAGARDVTVTAVSGAREVGGAGTRPTGGSASRSSSRSPPRQRDRPGLTVVVGGLGDAEPVAALRDARVSFPGDLPREGYALAAFRRTDGGGTIALAGADPAGTFYAAQTLRQLVVGGAVAGLGIVDRPAMARRGTVEGFYGSPWTTAERLDQLDFYGRFKLNTYIYAPKEDPYHRDRWREPYPPDQLAELARLVDAADANHVDFTFAVSPGVSICYGEPADLAALVAKLDALYAVGVRSFALALDDIDHTRWNCPGDGQRYGPPSTAAAAQAQAELANALQQGYVAARAGVHPLVMVPTDYRGVRDSDYRAGLRARLDPAVDVMWTGRFVVPEAVTVADAGAAAATYGRPLYLWDNTPVNDFPATEGRLILAPYAGREPGLSGQLAGVALNPMNQAAASKVQLVGAADFAWNDAAYDPARAHRAAAAYLAGGDPETTETLLAFFDVENLAPTSLRGGTLSQPQAPVLAGELTAFRAAWSSGDRAGAIAGLRPAAERLAGAADLIRAGVADAGFVVDCGPWLDATALWGRALVATLDGLAARTGGDPAGADAHLAEARSLAATAAAVTTIPGETRPQGRVRVADGVLDVFLADARGYD